MKSGNLPHFNSTGAAVPRGIGHQWYRTYEYSDYNSSDEQSLTEVHKVKHQVQLVSQVQVSSKLYRKYYGAIKNGAPFDVMELLTNNCNMPILMESRHSIYTQTEHIQERNEWGKLIPHSHSPAIPFVLEASRRCESMVKRFRPPLMQ